MIDVSSMAVSAAPPSGANTVVAGGAGAAGADPVSASSFVKQLQQFFANADTEKPTLVQALLTGQGLPQEITNLLAEVETQEQEGESATALDWSMDPQLASQIAGFLQSMGFPIKPQELQSLSQLDSQQLDSALEFMQRNLRDGQSMEDVLENASLLMPRDWNFEGLDASPKSQESADFQKMMQNALAELRAELRQNLAKTTDATLDPSNLNLLAPKPTVTNPAAFALVAVPQDPQAAAHALLVPSHTRPGSLGGEMIGRQVLDRVQTHLHEGRRELTVRLWPEELGEVRLSLRMSNGDHVEARIQVENEAVRQAMLDATPQLRETLQKQGLDLDKLTVSVNSDGAAADSGFNARENKDQKKDHRDPGYWEDAELVATREVLLGVDTGRRDGNNTLDMWS